jgi:hypothetical protein
MTVTSGLKVALPGYDAQTAPDYDLSFSSNWPMLQVVKTLTHTITNADINTVDAAFPTYDSGTSGTSTVTFYHNLGYSAFADIWQYSPDSRFTNVVAERLNSRAGYQMYFGKNSIKVPVGSVYESSGRALIPVGATLSLKLYTFDFTQAFSYAAVLPPVGPSTYDPHVGIKIVRPGRDIKSKDLRNFIFHSKGSAPQILTVQTPTNANFTSGVVTYQIPNGIPARLDFLNSTNTADWDGDYNDLFCTGSGVLETSTDLYYYTNVFGQHELQAQGDVTYTMTSSGLFTSAGLLSTVPFSVIVRRDPLLYSAPTVITI